MENSNNSYNSGNNSHLINKIVPLASIDEDDEDDTIVPSTKINSNALNGGENLGTFKLIPNDDFLPSPVSDFNPAATTIHTDTDEFGDTGFFSSSLSSSKRSSIDFDANYSLSSQYNSLHSSKSFNLSNKTNATTNIDKIFDNTQHEDQEEDDDELLLTNIIQNEKCSIIDNNELNISGSLEDLVNSFDEKVKNCLKNYNENVDKLAPVQFRSQEEVIQNRPAWWTLTGNYGNILPIDWEKLSPDELDELISPNDDNNEELVEDDAKLNELINSCLDLDLHAPIKTADEVLKEIEDIISGKLIHGSDEPYSQCSSSRSSSVSVDYIPIILRSTFYRFSLDKLKTFSLDQLQDLYEDLEGKTRKHSQELVKRLDERDELEFEKEVKNTFLSLLVKIQKRRKEYYKKYKPSDINGCNRKKRRYLTTVIPYLKDSILNNMEALQTLIKILKAMLDDSPAVPTMLTDYILKFICPPAENLLLNNGSKTVLSPTKEINLPPIRPKSSPLQSLRENRNERSNGYLQTSLNQTLNNTIRVARKSFSFRNAIFGGSFPNNNNEVDSITNNATKLSTQMNNDNLMHSQPTSIDDLLNNNENNGKVDGIHNDANVLLNLQQKNQQIKSEQQSAPSAIINTNISVVLV